MDKLRALRYFAAVAETGSFTTAASQFKVPPSSLSRRIADLEEDLGATLLHRTTRLVKLTEVGRQYHNSVIDILDRLQRADEAVRSYQTKPQGTLRISSMPAFGSAVLLPVLDQFNGEYPDITLDLHFSDELAVLDRDGVDIAIRGGFAPNERLVAVRLMSNDFAPVAAPSYLEKHGIPAEVTELRSHLGLFYRAPRQPTPWLGYVNGQWQDVAAKPVAISNDVGWLMDQALAGRGIIMLPPWAYQRYVDSGQMRLLSFDPPLRVIAEGSTSVFLLYQTQRYQVPKIRVAVDYLVKHLRQE
ncbi:MAG: LysR family transcriptional regulator [Reinekea sp.]